MQGPLHRGITSVEQIFSDAQNGDTYMLFSSTGKKESCWALQVNLSDDGKERLCSKSSVFFVVSLEMQGGKEWLDDGSFSPRIASDVHRASDGGERERRGARRRRWRRCRGRRRPRSPSRSRSTDPGKTKRIFNACNEGFTLFILYNPCLCFMWLSTSWLQ